MAGNVTEFSDTNFEQEVLKAPTPVLVDLWAAWCVDPRSHVLLDWRSSCEAKSIQAGQQLLSLRQDKLIPGKVTNALLSNSLGHCLEVNTETGRRLRVTDEHQFLTRRGWKPASELQAGMAVTVVPVLEQVHRTTSRQSVLTDEAVRRVGLPRMKLQWYLKELDNKWLVPLTADHPKLPVIARLMGALFSDGWLYHQVSNDSREVGWVVGQREDALQVRDDLTWLGFPAHLDERVSHQQIGSRRFSAHTYRVKCRSTSAWLFFRALGAPEGNKTNSAYLVPPWLMSAPQLIQREFLAGYLGGDGPTPAIRPMRRPDKQPCDHLNLNDLEFHKRVDLKANGYRFARQLASLLDSFGVKIRGVHVEREGSRRKDGSRSVTIHIRLSATYESGYAICHRIGYAYATSKSSQAQAIGEFLRKKLCERDTWQRCYRHAKRLYEQGQTIPTVATRLGLPYNTAFDWLRRGVFPTIKPHHERYEAWLKRVTAAGEAGQLWERVISVKPIYLPTVSRLSVTPHHNFIAEGFVVHNCGPCRVIAPIVEELADTYAGKVKMGKINVDDYPQLAAQYRIMNIPTLLLFNGGQEVDRIVGVVPKQELARRLDKVLG